MALAVIFGVVFAVGKQNAAGRRAATKEADDDGEMSHAQKMALEANDAWHATKGVVLGHLKHPDEAEFGYPDPQEVCFKHGATWTCQGTVRSPNDFGMTMRTTFTCALVRDDDADKWSVESFSIGE